ncbi:hypothetical protein HDU78_007353 [Chytriomyces hyalinus]|nr:hypothetical protein HDU78_007353 [Chytriomyces hyalinus]
MVASSSTRKLEHDGPSRAPPFADAGSTSQQDPPPPPPDYDELSNSEVTLAPLQRSPLNVFFADKINDYELKQWGPAGSQRHRIVMRYWVVTRMAESWSDMRAKWPGVYLKCLLKGYCEPIHVSNNFLSVPKADKSLTTGKKVWDPSLYRTDGEERLYFVLNHMRLPNGQKSKQMTPVSMLFNKASYFRQAQLRNESAQQLPQDIQERYKSPFDISQNYSAQVPHIGNYAERTAAIHALSNDPVVQGTDHLETMILLDVSDCMIWDPRKGIRGPDKVFRYSEEPPSIDLVKQLLHRLMNHMVPREQQHDPSEYGIRTITFAGEASYVGKLSRTRFNTDWKEKVAPKFSLAPQPVPKLVLFDSDALTKKTCVLKGWRQAKTMHFEAMNRRHGHGYHDPLYGWQATSGMPKLSLLVFLNGETLDMDEFELELMGQSWAYVTIVLVGFENDPHHHVHAIQLERVARFNPHIAFFDVQGRVLERFLVEQLLKSVYPVDPPVYEEIVDQQFELDEKGSQLFG